MAQVLWTTGQADLCDRYTMIGVCPVLFVGWKLLKRSKFLKPEEVDLFQNLDEIEEYEANYRPEPSKYVIPGPFTHYLPDSMRKKELALTVLRRNAFERVLDLLFG